MKWNRTMKRTVATFCATGLVLSALTACGSQNSSGNTAPSTNKGSSTVQDPNTAKKSEPSAPTPIFIFNRVNPEVLVDNNPILQALEEKLNIAITYEAPPINNYLEKLQITMASGNIPDIIYNWGGADNNYEQWAKNGLLAELDDLLPNYPNILENVPNEMMEAMRSVETGKIHQIAKPNMINYWGFIINQNWLDAVDMKAPTTLEEFKEVARAFTNQDPDGNQRKDTYGLSDSSSTYIEFTPLKAAFGLADVKDLDGNYKIMRKMTGYVPYLTYIREMYQEGILDPEFFTNKYMVDGEKFRAGTVGILEMFQTGVLQQLRYMDDADVLDAYTYIAPLKNAYTGEQVVYTSPPIWGGWMISADSKNIEKCMEIIDYGNSEEGFTLMTLGLEGVHYNAYSFEDRMVDRTPEQAKELATISSSYLTFAFAKDGIPAIIENADTKERIDKFNKDFDAAKSVIKLVTLPLPKTPKYNTFDSENPDLVKKLSENEIKYVVGEITEEEFKNFLEKEYFPAIADAEAEYIAWMEANAKN